MTMEGEMKKLALILAVSLLFVVSAWAEEVPIQEANTGSYIDGSSKYQLLFIIKTEQKSRRHATECNSCSPLSEGSSFYGCTLLGCPTATYNYNEYSIGTSDGKILFTIEDTEKVEE